MPGLAAVVVFSTGRGNAQASHPLARRTMSDAPSAPPRDRVIVTPPRTARIAPIDPETPESQPAHLNHASINDGQQPQRSGGFGATGAASSEVTPLKREDEEDAEHHDALVNDVNQTHVSSDPPASDFATVVRFARDDDRTWADADECDDEEDETMAESGDECDLDVEPASGVEDDAFADDPANDDPVDDTDIDERDDVDEIEDEDMIDTRPERWSFLDLRGGHHALDLYREVRLVVFRARARLKFSGAKVGDSAFFFFF